MFGMMKQPRHQCRECLSFNTGTGYGKPVCYEIDQRDGRPVAVAVKPNKTACHNFRAGGSPVYRH